MKKMYCIKCNKYRESKKCHAFSKKKKIVLSIICKECGSNNDTVFRKAGTIQILKINGLIHNVTG